MKLLLGLLAILAACSAAYGLRCYVCNAIDMSRDDFECGDHFDKHRGRWMMEECSHRESYCIKRKTQDNRVERGCTNYCGRQSWGTWERIYCCQGDGCNGSGALAGSLILVAGTFLLKHLF